jgi:membrane protein
MSKVPWFCVTFAKKFQAEKVFSLSASLTYVTLLGFIPFIIFLLFFLPQLSFLRIEENLQNMVKTIFVPESAEQVYNYIAQLTSQNITFNLFSFIILLFTSYSLFKIINDTFDNILNVHELRKRGFLGDLTKFFGMSIFGSLLIMILFSASSLPVFSKFISLPFLQGISLYLTPFVILLIIFSLGFFLIPTIKLRKRSILIGAAISSIVWIIFKSIFNWYIITFTNIELIFGVLASVPVFLFWIYSNWIIILSGVIIVSILENRHEKVTLKPENQPRVRITFEKVIDEDTMNHICTSTMELDQLREILHDILHEGEEKKTKK